MIASVRHTVILLLILAVVSAGSWSGRRNASPAGTAHNLVALYLGVIVSEWLLVRYAVIGVRKRGGSLVALAGLRDGGAGRWAVDIACGLALVPLLRSASAVLRQLLGNYDDHAGAILPRTPLEIALWVFVALSAGICEELVYRAYLQQQFGGMIGSRGAAVVLQAIVFALTHGYQGWRSMVVITVYGLAFGALTWWRGNVRSSSLAHVLIDLIGGLSR